MLVCKVTKPRELTSGRNPRLLPLSPGSASERFSQGKIKENEMQAEGRSRGEVTCFAAAAPNSPCFGGRDSFSLVFLLEGNFS